MDSDYSKPFRLSLKLKDGASPHLYVTQLKEFMKNDTSLHPMMEKTLKLLKKTRTPFIQLSFKRELVYDPRNLRHFDRSADPVGSWVCTIWSEEEAAEHKKDPEGHLKSTLKFFNALGYETFNMEIVSEDYLQSLAKLTFNQIQSQMEQRQEEEFDKGESE